jgi:hypothetical protein
MIYAPPPPGGRYYLGEKREKGKRKKDGRGKEMKKEER